MQIRQNRQPGKQKNISQIRRETMKKVKQIRLLSLLLAGGFGLMQAPTVFAAAGDTIGNTATINYSVGTVPQTDIESAPGAGNSTPGVGVGTSTDFVEDRLINFTVANGGSTGQVTPGATLQWTEFTVDNTGNATQDFLLAGLNNANGTADPFGGNNDSFDATPGTIQVFVESNPVPDGFQPGTDTAVFIDELAAGAQATVYVVSTIPLTNGVPAPLVNGDVAVMSLLVQAAAGGAATTEGAAIVDDDNAHASPGGTFSNGGTVVGAGTGGTDIADNPATMQTVFGDVAGTQDGATDAQHSADSSYTVLAAVLNVTKISAALWDPINADSNPKSIPGGYVRYTITIENTGTVSADLTTITDTLAGSLDIDPDLGSGNAGNTPVSGVGDSFEITHVDNAVTQYCTAAADADACGYAPAGPGGTVTVDIGTEMGANATLAPGESLTVIFNAIVQ
jgi:uncharacterized repeat protein (TIGR01451 family)